MEHIRGREGVDLRRVVFFGRSLGGAVAVRAAAKHPDACAALILENTFTSIADMVDIVMPFLSKVRIWPCCNRGVSTLAGLTSPRIHDCHFMTTA